MGVSPFTWVSPLYSGIFGLHGRLNYCVGGEVQTLHHLDRRMYLLGYSTYTRAPV